MRSARRSAAALGAALMAAAYGVTPLAGAEPPARSLEWRRASAPAVYVGAVTGVREVAPAVDTDTGPRMEADVRVDAVLRAPAPAGAGDGAAPVTTVLRYEEPAGEPRAGVFHHLRPGDRLLVFASSLGREYPIEVVSGPPARVRAEVTALRDAAARLDPAGLALHGVDAPTRDAQVKLYDAALAALRR